MSEDMERLQEEMSGLRDDLQEIKQELAKYKGFVGGCIWVAGAMLAAVKLAWPFIEKLLGFKTGG